MDGPQNWKKLGTGKVSALIVEDVVLFNVLTFILLSMLI